MPDVPLERESNRAELPMQEVSDWLEEVGCV
jgi:hypothetical protein